MWTRLRNYFFTGLAVFAPIGVTVYLVWLFVRSVDGLVARLIPPPYAPSDWLPIAVPGLGLVIAVIAITVSRLTRMLNGRWPHGPITLVPPTSH